MGRRRPCRGCGACVSCGQEMKKKERQLPIIVQFHSHEGVSAQLRLDPPNWKEVERFVRCQFERDDLELYHAPAVGRLRRLRNQADFEKAVFVTPYDRVLDIVIGFYPDKGGPPCCCCKRPDPLPIRHDVKWDQPLDLLSDIPKWMRDHMVFNRPFQTWNECIEVDTKGKKEEQKIDPLMPALK